MTTVIIDYGSGNLHSVANALRRAAHESAAATDIIVTADPEAVRAAGRVVLPGVGAFADCRSGLAAIPGMIDAIEAVAMTRAKPFLGICVGMQLMAERGLEHGPTDGFGWIKGEIAPLEPADPALKIPHMGWNALDIRGHHTVLNALPGPGPHVYFVHSYALTGGQNSECLATADYGGPVAAVVGRDNLIGTQFHPEKSQAVGQAFLQGFLAWRP